MKLAGWLVCFAVAGALAAEASKSKVAVAAADLVYCLDALNQGFAKAPPGRAVRVATGSSGNFFAQIKNGAPLDGFLSADRSFPRELIKAVLADESRAEARSILDRFDFWLPE